MKALFEGIIPSVNYHLWEPCNMRCKFCFAPFYDAKKLLPKGHLPKEKSLELIQRIADFGFQKITFAGGEPTLCPWISELIAFAKEKGLTTMLVTNGTRLTEEFLNSNKNHLDWIILSIDSADDETNINSGRAVTGKTPVSLQSYKIFIDAIKKHRYRLKINTVVHRLNYKELLLELINYAQPERWKVFQVLPIKGENDLHITDFIINDFEFNHFISNHRQLKEEGILISEDNSEMKNSYVMIDPAGRFYTNKKGMQEYSSPILETGIKAAYDQMEYSFMNFKKRGGLYAWKKAI
ncbi:MULTISPECIES: viperin family antiviral radical SAM protein [unclassified Kaistella]|uniref:viperin family antiviral radical SAM protein n=1 Tax=unclassified Kaistella TaxID=2762626 RepID=UPI0027340981|nr:MULTISPECIES: viperin family antiviral radical SAM protein [unclassified Kaistella]MDP2455071.1 viperin family antiviral radical SAM protein [Kaistella sp. SH11-4b]MDP2457979.1 viperin family antiviral radical SAM protein [Kaistella sp. SH40-3]MDP2460877.1 viperin family antiviral radical SAM protein [Kaistella sp. SH19-2b]